MKFNIKTILIAILGSLAGVILISNGVQADVMPVNFTFQNAPPLFNEANFLPSQSVSRWIKADNTSSTDSFDIATKCANYTDEGGLGHALDFQIKNGATSLYSKTLFDFCHDSDIFLSTLAPLGHIQYDYNITFQPNAGNDYQGKTLTFDILIGSSLRQQETPTSTPPGDGNTYTYVGGGGGTNAPYNPPQGEVLGVSTTNSVVPPGGSITGGVGSEGQGGEPGEIAGASTSTIEQASSSTSTAPYANPKCMNPWILIIIGLTSLTTAFLSSNKDKNKILIYIIGLLILAIEALLAFTYCLSWWFMLIVLAGLVGLSLLLLARDNSTK